FWSVPGYLGAESGSSVQAARLVLDTRIASTLGEGAPEVSTHLPARQSQPAGGVDESWHGSRRSAVAAIRLAAPAPVDSQGAELHVLSGDAAGARLMLRAVVGDLAVLDLGNDPDVVDRLRTGDRVRVDNSNVLAAQTYHRHQVPADGGFAVWDQFRDGDGTPSHPQRPMLIGPRMAAGAAGSAQSGRFDGKMIMVASLLDREAYPWQADWYRTQVTGQLGEAADEHYRLWYVDHAVHGDESLADDPRHTVSYVGVLHHALRALAAWVEDGTPPPATTGYRVVDGQVVPAASAGERHGVQPVVRLSVDGGDRADVPAGAEVSLRVTAELPDGAGRLVSVEWDLDDDGTFGVAEPITTNGTSLALERRHAFGEAGTGFVTVRVTAQREGDPDAAFARVANIARVRVVTH
ncbi:MAG TPA: hypothetical protein VFN19_06185, partial [Candidatus Nanopelagicales bacterium]|nr:hypothetical protein [Candidatus Nanopelagicales bacterium]